MSDIIPENPQGDVIIDASPSLLEALIMPDEDDQGPVNEPGPRTESLADRLRANLTGGAKSEDSPSRKARADERATRQRKINTEAEKPSKPGEFTEQVQNYYALAALGLSAYDTMKGHDDHQCGMIIAGSAEDLAVKWDALAQKSPAVRRTLRKMGTTSDAGALIMAHLPIAMSIMAAHNMRIPFMPNLGPVETEDDQAPNPEPEYGTEANSRRV